MLVEQKKLQHQNEVLQRRAEKTDQQYLESMESLSEIIGEVIAPSAEVPAPASTSSASVQTDEQDLPVMHLPTADGSL